MCGVISIINLSSGQGHSQPEPIQARKLQAGLEAMHHRGPDGKKYWLSPDGNVALGHARLAIIAVADGDQPLANEDETIRVVVNGELYDHQRLGRELAARGHKIATSSDSEIALHLYEEHGVDFLKELRGEFALCLYDERKQRLLLARDRFGIKPLCYSVQNGKLYAASEAKALFAAGLPCAFDEESVFHTLNMQYTLSDRTLFQNIKQLPPGHFLLVEDGQIKIADYFDLDYPLETSPTEESATLSRSLEQEYIEEFARLFEESVRLRLFADFPVVCHLSGGLDSASVLAMAAKNSGRPLHCFTVSFQEEGYDELPIAREMADLVQAELHTVQVSNLDIINNLEDACYLSEGLAVNGHLSAKHILNKTIHQAGFRVSLTGEGSDEVLAGYPHLRSDLLASRGEEEKLQSLYAENPMSKGIMLASGPSLSLKSVEKSLGFVPSFLKAKGTLGKKMTAVASPAFLSAFAHRDAYEELLGHFDVAGQLTGRNRVHQSLYLWSKTALANYILRTLGDGVEMGQSLEGRLPFLDHKLFEFLRQLPLNMKIKGETEKYILKQALEKHLTRTIYERHKHPFVAPPLSRFADQGARRLMQEKLSDPQFARLGFFDQNKLLNLLDNLETLDGEERAAVDPVLMTALSYLSLQRRFMTP